MAENKSASTSAENKSEQQLETPAPKATTKAARAVQPKYVRGVPVTTWDDPKAAPTERTHVGDDPEGKSNKLKGH